MAWDSSLRSSQVHRLLPRLGWVPHAGDSQTWGRDMSREGRNPRDGHFLWAHLCWWLRTQQGWEASVRICVM